MDVKRLLLVAVLAATIAAVFGFDAHRYLSAEFLASSRAAIDAWHAAHPWRTAAAFFALYVGVAALSLPGAALLTVAAGAIFGLVTGTLLVSFASSLGATAAFGVSRFLLRDWVRARLGERLRAIDAGLARDGALYLFALRLVPAFPFWLINLALGLTALRTWTFYWVSQLGMLAGTVVFVYAGTQLGGFRASAGLLFAFALLGLFPLIAKKALERLQARRVYAPWRRRRPARTDYNLVVIGAGSAGLVSAYIGAATRARVALVERDRMGGDCLNTGCVPSKALLRSARLLSDFARAPEFGIDGAARVDFAAVMERVARVVRTIEPHDSAERYAALGVEVVHGNAKITSPWTVEVDGAHGRTVLTTQQIIVATGARPLVPPIPGLAEAGYLTSDTVWNLRVLPRRLVVLGGGPIGCELAQAFARFGAAVTQIEMQPRLLVREDADVSALVRERFEAEGVRVLLEHRATRVVEEAGEKVLVAEHAGGEVRVPFDAILVAVGRVPNTRGYGLEELGIPTSSGGTIETDAWLRTLYPNIHACGDVAGPYQFTHAAAHQAWHAAVNALFGRFRRFRIDDRVMPWTTFTDPQVARVGLNEQQAREQGVPYTVTRFALAQLDRAIADGEPHGFIKVLTRPGSDRILGVTIAGEHAGELLAEYVLAMKHGLGLARILGTVHAYPTLADANKLVAGAWKRSTVTQGQWTFLQAFHAWQRGALRPLAVLAALPALLTERGKAYAGGTQ